MSKSNYPTQVELRECFELRVDFRNGYETLWRKGYTDKSGHILKEKLVECKANSSDGYCYVGFKERIIKYHTLAWILTHGDIPEGLMIDHVEGDKIDNQISNLKLVTSRQNNGNKRVHREGKLVGCYYHKPTNTWLSQIRLNDKNINLGYYDSEEEASTVYLKARELMGQYIDNKQFRKLLLKG